MCIRDSPRSPPPPSPPKLSAAPPHAPARRRRAQRPKTPGQTDVWGWQASRPPAGQKSSSSGGG
eukprot:6734556-Prymnesium_polylepis.1